MGPRTKHTLSAAGIAWLFVSTLLVIVRLIGLIPRMGDLNPVLVMINAVVIMLCNPLSPFVAIIVGLIAYFTYNESKDN